VRQNSVQDEVFPNAVTIWLGAGQLVVDQGIVSLCNPKPGKSLNRVVVEVVKSFCNCGEVSRVLPGKQYYISIKISGAKIREWKQWLFCNFKELYSHFKNLRVGVEVWFS
jgi:hypothetical protein